MNHRSRHAFTLLEITIGMGLLIVLIGFFLLILRGSSRESALSSDHFTGAMLSQKVVEDLMEEVDLNPHGLSALGIEESAPLSPTPVVDGAAPFFKQIEDRNQPWGRIEGQQEGTIDSSYVPLFNLVRSFRVSAQGKRLAPSGSTPEYRHLIESGVRFDWNPKAGTGNMSAGCRLFAPVGAKPASAALNVPENLVDGVIANEFFEEPGQSPAKLIADSGADAQTVRRLALVQVFTRGVIEAPGFQQAIASAQQAELKLQGPFATKLAEYEARQEHAKAAFDLANSCFLACHLLATDVALLKNACTEANLGTILYHRPEEFTVGLRNYGKLYETWRRSVAIARKGYLDLLSPNLAGTRGGKQHLFVIRRLLDLFRIVACDPAQPAGLSQYRLFLANLQKAVDGRNPYLFRTLQQEVSFCDSVTSLAAKHPFLTRVQLVTDRAMPACSAILEQFANLMNN